MALSPDSNWADIASEMFAGPMQLIAPGIETLRGRHKSLPPIILAITNPIAGTDVVAVPPAYKPIITDAVGRLSIGGTIPRAIARAVHRPAAAAAASCNLGAASAFNKWHILGGMVCLACVAAQPPLLWKLTDSNDGELASGYIGGTINLAPQILLEDGEFSSLAGTLTLDVAAPAATNLVTVALWGYQIAPG